MKITRKKVQEIAKPIVQKLPQMGLVLLYCNSVILSLVNLAIIPAHDQQISGFWMYTAFTNAILLFVFVPIYVLGRKKYFG